MTINLGRILQRIYFPVFTSGSLPYFTTSILFHNNIDVFSDSDQTDVCQFSQYSWYFKNESLVFNSTQIHTFCPSITMTYDTEICIVMIYITTQKNTIIVHHTLSLYLPSAAYQQSPIDFNLITIGLQGNGNVANEIFPL